MELDARPLLVVVQTERVDAGLIPSNQSDVRLHKGMFEGIRDFVQCLEKRDVDPTGL